MLKMSTGSIEPSPSPSPGSFPTTISVPNGVPKVGTLVPNRVFVGGISSNTTETELHQLFSEFGNVKQTKIIADRAGVSKGYGFVTFETEEEARRLQAASEDIVLKERKLNIAPAIKKQTYGRSYEMGQPVVNGAIYYHNGIPYTYQQNGVAMFVTDGQPCIGGVVSPTSGKASTPTTPFSLVYPGSGGTMFLPSPAAAVSQQQLQLQAAAALREAVQSQTGGSGSSNPGSGAAWRWITPQTSAVGTTGSCQQSPSAATSPAQSNPANHQLNQALTFNQESGSSTDNSMQMSSSQVPSQSNLQQQPTTMWHFSPPQPNSFLQTPNSLWPQQFTYLLPSPDTTASFQQPQQLPLNQQPQQLSLNQQQQQLSLNQQPQQLTLSQQPQQLPLNQQPQQLPLNQQPQQLPLNQQPQQLTLNQQPPSGIEQQPANLLNQPTNPAVNQQQNSMSSHHFTVNPSESTLQQQMTGYPWQLQSGQPNMFSPVQQPATSPMVEDTQHQDDLAGKPAFTKIMDRSTASVQQPHTNSSISMVDQPCLKGPEGVPAVASPYLQIVTPMQGPDGTMYYPAQYNSYPAPSGYTALMAYPPSSMPYHQSNIQMGPVGMESEALIQPPTTKENAEPKTNHKDCGSESEGMEQIRRSPDPNSRRVRQDSCDYSMQYTNDVFYQGGGSRFVFPSSIHPNTPTTPSIHPVLGSKTGFIIPQSPNPMTNTQFANYAQSPGYMYPTALPTPATPVDTFNSNTKGGLRKGGEMTQVVRFSDRKKSEENNCFESPFKRFVPFTGTPSSARFPLQRVPPPRHPPRKQFTRFAPNQPPRTLYNPNQNPRRGNNVNNNNNYNYRNNRKLSESKGGFYMAGERFGQKVHPDEKEADRAGQDSVLHTPPHTPPTKLLLAEPDLLQGRMKRLEL